MTYISKQQMKYLVMFGTLLVLSAGAVLVMLGYSQRSGITIYSDGYSTYVSPTSPHYRDLQPLVEQLFMNPSNGLPEGITSQLLKDLTTSGTSVELIYDHPITLLQNYNTATASLQVARLLIRLEGTHKGWMLYGNGHYQSGPFVTTDNQTMKRLQRLISDVH